MQLPPMSTIRVFEAAARHQSFTRAAEELGMTQAAVSYQIRLLEDRVGLPLFVRLPRQVVLTAKGRELAPAITEAFSLLRAAFTDFEDRSETTLSLTTMTTIASNWLIPRLGRLKALHPELAVQISISDQMVDFSRSEFDVGIRSGLGEWPGLEAHRLIPNHFTPACGPSLLQGTPPYAPEAILQMPLLSPRDPWWQDWTRAAGLGEVDLSDRPDNAFGTQQFEGLAAMSGQGVALINPYFFGDDIAAGRLVPISDVMVRSDRPYWLVYPKTRHRSKRIKAFRDWILTEAASDIRRNEEVTLAG
ncbi:LysR substrate-binding domain-containing protein [Microvirga pudoricolor]|uniref:LysR substrate-binding domain-containing protein n=1 Tax=Microvirga pudoricolor TaxID=2778729 RepID=UPI00194EFB2D|nr:LysR substrate-binding domain-containing protein [Microvirga pudoricolor]MBM6595662.1 LysR family transcriptional regulator [Microvirga pudoricolor]